MPDDVHEPPRPDKGTVTPKPKAVPRPICMLLSDCTITMEPDVQVNPMDLQRMLLSAAAHITAQIIQHSMLADRVVAKIAAEFDGFDDETEQAIKRVLNQ